MTSNEVNYQTVPAYLDLHRDILINADLWGATPQILAASFGFEGIMGIPNLSSSTLDLAAAAGAGLNNNLLSLDPLPPLRNLTSASSPEIAALSGFGGLPLYYDAMPIEFSWPLLPSSVSPSDIEITLNTGEKVNAILAALNPNYDYNEKSTLVVFGEFGNRLTPGEEGAVYPVSVTIADDGTPLMAVGPDGPVSLVGLTVASGNPYVTGPTLVGAKLTELTDLGDFPPQSLAQAAPNDGVSLYGDEGLYRLRLFTSGGFSPDGVSGLFPTDYSKFFRLHATDSAGNDVSLTEANTIYDLGVGSVEVLGLADIAMKANGTTVNYDYYYVDDHDNYFDIILSGNAEAIARLTQVEIPTSAVEGYSDLYNPGGPGMTPVEGVTYTKPSAGGFFDIDISLDSLDTVNYAEQSLSAYDPLDDLPVVFRLYNAEIGKHFYTSSSIEANNALALGYSEEGVPFSNEQYHTNLADVYRFFCPTNGDHIYTTSVDEFNTLSGNALYKYEGVAFSVMSEQVPGSEAVHRFYSSVSGDHFYTPDFAEGSAAATYAYEGIAWYTAIF